MWVCRGPNRTSRCRRHLLASAQTGGGLLLSGRLLIPKSAGADTCQAAGPPLLCTRICQNEWFLSKTQIAVSLKVTLPVSVSLLVW